MAEFRMRYGALFTSRRVRASATVSVSVVIESRKPTSTGLGAGIEHRAIERRAVEHRRALEADDHPELAGSGPVFFTLPT